jgi:superfamily II DNA or RNA helicase
MIQRFSSRRQQIGASFLNKKLQGALAYDRIAGYFSSSLLEVAGEAIDTMQGIVRVVCNSNLDVRDVQIARSAEMALRQEWCTQIDHLFRPEAQLRFKNLYNLLQSGKLQIRVLPSEVFGLIHGKAGVITTANETKTTFLGSINETKMGWQLNYELLWEDNSEEAVKWVQEEFDALWNNPNAVPLARFIIEDIGRLANRKIISYNKWKEKPAGASVAVESPVYRSEFGLWAHQKYFVKKTFDDHISGLGARYVLADMVGLGKTIQLALAAQLMALHGDKPVLIIVPKTLILQWQDEMFNLLDMPSAYWDGRQWIDEHGIKYSINGNKPLKKCPRRVGIISQGLIVHGAEIIQHLLELEYECVIVDESHRARRQNLRPEGENDIPNPNNLMRFLYQLSPRTKSMLLATATPVQMYPIEAFDLLEILSQGNDQVLGNEFSRWRQDKVQVMRLIQKLENPPDELYSMWDWVRNPLPSSNENEQFFGVLRRRLDIKPQQCVIEGKLINELSHSDRNRIVRNNKEFFDEYNPFIRNIIRRTREFLESTIDPETGEAYLKPIKVELFGETENEAIELPGYLKDAYLTAEQFSEELGSRMPSGGFMRTMLLRRIGSSIKAGENTARKMLNEWSVIGENIEEESEVAIFDVEQDDDFVYEEKTKTISRTLTVNEKRLLEQLIQQLEANKERDPKYINLREYLVGKNWLDLGCIIFSQYYDTIWFMSNQLSEDFPDLEIGIYAGGNKSGILKNNEFQLTQKNELKSMVKEGKIKVLFGTDAASEGLNLQRLSTLINLDLPWNPTRLEQRKGRIQRIGQLRDTVYIYNMRYKDSVEDRVHQLLSGRLEGIYRMFGQIPDVLEDVWIEVALGNKERAKEIIDNVPEKHPFEMKYNKIENVDWESCSEVLNNIERKQILRQTW